MIPVTGYSHLITVPQPFCFTSAFPFKISLKLVTSLCIQSVVATFWFSTVRFITNESSDPDLRLEGIAFVPVVTQRFCLHFFLMRGDLLFPVFVACLPFVCGIVLRELHF